MRRQLLAARDGHTIPFFLWIGVILLLQLLEGAGWCPRQLYPWSYAVKSVACLALFLAYRPWRIYPSLSVRHLPLAIAAGVLVTVLWILPETPFVARALPRFQGFSYKWLVMMPGSFPSYAPELPPGHLSWAYSVEEAGWGLALAKLFGSGVVIATAEEFFFRGFLYRWLQDSAFWKVRLAKFDARAFCIVLAVFAFEHDRWLAGALAGLVYGLLAVRTGDIWCCALAHGTTNTLLGIYVLHQNAYGFW